MPQLPLCVLFLFFGGKAFSNRETATLVRTAFLVSSDVAEVGPRGISSLDRRNNAVKLLWPDVKDDLANQEINQAISYFNYQPYFQ